MRKILHTYVLSTDKKLNNTETLKDEVRKLTEKCWSAYFCKRTKEELYSFLGEDR